jgi:hypothetical protein
MVEPTLKKLASAPSTEGRAGELLPLTVTKLAAPRQRDGAIDRPRITGQIDAGAGTALTLVAAPPGYGKTTAVRAWCASRRVASSWVTLDAGENDPFRLWMYVATAIDRVRRASGSLRYDSCAPWAHRSKAPSMSCRTGSLDSETRSSSSWTTSRP